MSRRDALSIDAAACDGVGICALVAPDLITLDGWGFPLINDAAAAARPKKARAAARSCPHRALRVEP
ncbi:MAG TPA: ferredoxin [Actinomycetes bacterium]|nr:ferredoxin [Actinomycetes bacterium]